MWYDDIREEHEGPPCIECGATTVMNPDATARCYNVRACERGRANMARVADVVAYAHKEGR